MEISIDTQNKIVKFIDFGKPVMVLPIDIFYSLEFWQYCYCIEQASKLATIK